ncbi:MAG: DUF4397 domain-containing protein [Vicinamibacterales bacterium]
MNKTISLVCCVAGALIASGCQRESTQNTPSTTTTTPAGQSTAAPAAAAASRDNALVRFVHAIPAGAAVDLSAGDNRFFENVAYKTVTPYRELDGQRYTFSVRPAGMAQASALASNSEGLDDGSYYTVFAVPGDGEAAMLRVVEDDFSAPGAGKARVRVVHASSDAGEVDVIATGRADELFDGVDFQSATEYDEIDPVSGSLEIRAGGESTPMLTVPNVRIEAGKVYTVVVVGKVRATPKLEAFVIEDRIGMPSR